LRNPTFHYQVHKSTPLDSSPEPLQSIPAYSFDAISVICTHAYRTNELLMDFG